MLSFVVERAALDSPAQVGRVSLGVGVLCRHFAHVFAPRSRHLTSAGSSLSPQPEQ
jgi:hypothetical protein